MGVRSDHVKKFDERLKKIGTNKELTDKISKDAADWAKEAAKKAQSVETLSKDVKKTYGNIASGMEAYARYVVGIIDAEDKLIEAEKAKPQDPKKIKELENKIKSMDAIADKMVSNLNAAITTLIEQFHKIRETSVIDKVS